MVFVLRYKSFRRYQSKSQCVAFRNQVQTIAKALPRTLKEVFVNVKDIYGHADITIRIITLKNALAFLKRHHPAYDTIQNSQENFKNIKNDTDTSKTTAVVPKSINDNAEVLSASQVVRVAGQN